MVSDCLKLRLLIGLGVGASALAATVAYNRYKYKKLQTPPKKWRQIGTIEEIYFFPVKSCAPITLDKAVCENLGILENEIRERVLMVVDNNSKPVTARTYTNMYKIQPKITAPSKLLISAPGMEDIELDYKQLTSGGKKTIKSNFYDKDVYVVECGPQFDKWFSKFILNKDEGLRLVYYADLKQSREIVEEMFDNGIFLKSDTGTLSDVSSYMLIHENSVNELNTRVTNKVDPLNFRGNFVIRTNQAPYAEDHWSWIKIGEEVIFRSLSPCYRCIIPNINPFTSERDRENEPLKTLKTYRSFDGYKSPRLGVQMGIRKEGVLKKGDAVYVEDLIN